MKGGYKSLSIQPRAKTIAVCRVLEVGLWFNDHFSNLKRPHIVGTKIAEQSKHAAAAPCQLSQGERQNHWILELIHPTPLQRGRNLATSDWFQRQTFSFHPSLLTLISILFIFFKALLTFNGASTCDKKKKTQRGFCNKRENYYDFPCSSLFGSLAQYIFL